MDNKTIIKRINDAIVNLEGVPAMTHEARKRMVIAEEMLIQLMQELDKEEKEEKNNEKEEDKNADKNSTNK